MAFRCNAQHHISGPAEDPALLPGLIMDTVHKDKRVDGIERTGLPLFDFREDPVCDLTDHFSGQFNPIKVLKLVMDIPGAEASGIKGDHLILNAGDISLVFGDELWLEFLNIPFTKCTLFADQVHPFR